MVYLLLEVTEKGQASSWKRDIAENDIHFVITVNAALSRARDRKQKEL